MFHTTYKAFKLVIPNAISGTFLPKFLVLIICHNFILEMAMTTIRKHTSNKV